MDFQHSERAQKVMAQVQRFLDERILPNEQTYLDQQTMKVLDEAEKIAKKAGDSFVPVERILTALAGSLWLMVLTTLFAVPVGVGTAIYLEEYAPSSRWKRPIRRLALRACTSSISGMCRDIRRRTRYVRVAERC